MKSGFEWRVEDVLRATMPTFFAFILVMAAAVPYGVPRLSAVMPWLGLMPIYYWSVREPSSMPYWAAFAIGLWQDLVSGGPVGLFALIYVLVRHFVVEQRLVFYKKPFFVAWWGFGLVCLFVAFGGWLLASIYFTRLLAFPPFMVQASLSVFLYPLVAWIMGGVFMVVARS